MVASTRSPRCLGKLVLLAVATSCLLFTASASAQNCLQNEYSLQNSQSLNCTANDVRIAQVSNVKDPATGLPLANCVLGSKFDFIADFQVVTSSTSSRSNIGMYIATNSTTQALTGTCADNVIPPPATFTGNGKPAKFPCTAGSTVLCGTDWYDEFDPSPDTCGDSSSGDAGGGFAGTQIITMLIQNYSCTPPAGTNQLVLPNCTSWQVPGKTLNCTAPSGQQSYNANAIPGSPSKCNCEVISLPIIAQVPKATVAKACTTTDSTGFNTSCSSGTEGVDEVTYTITVSNTSNFGSITLTQLTDSVYGTIVGVGSFTGDNNNGCDGTTIAAGSHVTCTFTAHKAGDPPGATVTDQATATFTAEFGGGFTQQSNQVVVTPVEAPSSATVTKSLNSLRAASITARFAVDVKNTSATTFDENETLTALSDSVFGNISPTPSASIVGTNCFNSGSESITPGNTYSCTYDVTIPLTALSSVHELGTGTCGGNGLCSAGLPSTTACSKNSDCDLTCLGLSHSNYVTATINGDEGATDTVSPTRNILNTNVCLSSFSQSQ